MDALQPRQLAMQHPRRLRRGALQALFEGVHQGRLAVREPGDPGHVPMRRGRQQPFDQLAPRRAAQPAVPGRLAAELAHLRLQVVDHLIQRTRILAQHHAQARLARLQRGVAVHRAQVDAAADERVEKRLRARCHLVEILKRGRTAMVGPGHLAGD